MQHMKDTVRELHNLLEDMIKTTLSQFHHRI